MAPINKSMSRGGGPMQRRSTRTLPGKLKLNQLLFAGLGIFLVGYSFLVLSFLKVSDTHDKNMKLESLVKPKMSLTTATTNTKNSTTPKHYSKTAARRTFNEWKELAVNLAGKLPHEVLEILNSEDPFGVRGFEERLLQAESDKEALLEMSEVQSIFPCPSERITLPDVRNHAKAAMFRNGTRESFLFFQHLRKAGGTNFCTLAQHNLPKREVPHYYCMPDMDWSDRRCAGCFTKFTNEQIPTNMHRDGHRILGNEWDPFDPSRFFELPATFTTSFRKPLDRAVSQFRFECVEDRVSSLVVRTNMLEHWSPAGIP
jgi:hypothetical protein